MGKPRGAGGGQTMFESAIRQGGAAETGTANADDIYADSSTHYAIVDALGGNDNVKTHDWNSIVNAGTGDDTVISGNAGDFVYGGEGNDRLVGQDFATRQIDVLSGETGNDTLVNQGGFVRMIGGLGQDVYEIDTTRAQGTTITDFNVREGDVVRLTGIDATLAQSLAAGGVEAIVQRYNLRLEDVRESGLQAQVVTAASGEATIEIRGRS